jgi:hypothetical protein
MHKRLLPLILSVVLLAPGALANQRGHSSGSGHARSSTSHSSRGSSKCASAPAVSRNSHGRIKRSAAAKAEFERESGYPHGRKGYVVDHITPLASGGADAPSNMQWQTEADAKAKDKTERK